MLSSAGGSSPALHADGRKSSDDRPSCLENSRPGGGGIYPNGDVASPFHAEPRHVKFERFSDEKTSATCSARPQAAVRKSGNGMPKPFPQHAPQMSLVHGPLQFILLRSQDSQ